MQTITNLTKAFIGESQARSRYTMYSKIAKKEGFEQLAEIFLITAENEAEHAKWLMRMINQLKSIDNINSLEVEADSDFTLGTTEENLESAINGETYEHENMYPNFAETAEKEGFVEIAERLRAIGKAEFHHKERFENILENIKNGSLFSKSQPQSWTCRKCGYLHEGNTPPQKCPSCDHPENYFEIKCEKY